MSDNDKYNGSDSALRDSNRRLEAFLEISRAMTRSLNLKTLMQTIVDHAVRVTHLGSGAIYLLEGDTLHLAATTPALPADFPANLRETSLDDHSHIRRAVRLGGHVLMPDSKNASLSLAEQAVVRARNLRTSLYLPISLDETVIGVLILSSIDELHTFNPEEIALLEGFSNHAAQAINNVRHYEQALDNAKRLEQQIEMRERAEEEQTRLQVQLNQAQKMESIGRLAGGVAHDFNNMLGVILGHTEMTMRRTRADDPMLAGLKEIHEAAVRSAELTRQLLTFARRQTVSPRVLDINATVGGSLKMLKRLIGEDVDLAWTPTPDLKPVNIDPSQVDQILANLCINARDAIVDVGKITIETGNASFDEAYCAAHVGFVPGDYVLLAVSDNGCGIAPDILPHIFEPFFTTKEIGKGTGLGLATVYGAVRQNRGFVNVYSEVDHGTTFRVYLPSYDGDDSHRKAPVQRSSDVKGSETVLLVEDEPIILEMITAMLEELGYAVLATASPEDAIRISRRHSGRIHLLFTDVIMPEMNGRDLSRNILESRPKTAVLFMSGYTANVIAHHGVLESGVHFIQKPFSLSELGHHLRRALEDSKE